MVLGDNGSTLSLFQQNNPVGAPSQTGTFSKNYLLGYLRPIKQS